MTPTMKLRFVERTVREYSEKHQSYQPKKIRVLQQWWHLVEYKEETRGEWRDVPLEVEE